MARVRFFKMGYAAWLIVPLAFFAFAPAPATWYVIWSYEWRGSRGDWKNRQYTRCTYVGWRGTLTDYPTDGKCGWLRFSNAHAARQ